MGAIYSIIVPSSQDNAINGANKVAKIIKDELINNPKFRFNHVGGYEKTEVSIECNSLFPYVIGYNWNDPRNIHNGGIGHPDHYKRLFFWNNHVDYELDSPNNVCYNQLYKKYIIDGNCNYWNESNSIYLDKISNWPETGYYIDYDKDKKKISHIVPKKYNEPYDETGTDRSRRELYIRKFIKIIE